jgi:ParB family chromosome partitioning protein
VQTKRLGKGLDSLLSEVALENHSGQQVVDLALNQVQPNPEQPRKDFDEAALADLSNSITEVGVIQPIIVQEVSQGTYQIVAGERRYRASLLAGLTTIPAIVRNYDQEHKLEVALIENLQREDLNPIEEALAFRGLMDRFDLGQDEVAKRIGKNRSTVANSLRLLKLPESVREAIRRGELSAGHARTILSVPAESAEAFFAAIQSKELSVREAEALARAVSDGTSVAGALDQSAHQKLLQQSAGATLTADRSATAEPKSATAKRAAELWEMEEKLIVALGTKVQIKGDVSNGKIEIQYFSLDDLERIYEIMTRFKTGPA